MNYMQERYDRSRFEFGNYGFFVNHGLLSADFLMHTHEFYEAAIVISGTATHIIGEYSYPIKRGDVFVIKGDINHCYSQVDKLELLEVMYYPKTFSSSDFQLSSLSGFRSLFILEPEMRVQSHYPFVLTLKDNELEHVLTIINFIINECYKKIHNYHVAAKLSVAALFSYLSVKYTDHKEESDTSQILSKAIWYMQENLTSQIKTSDISSYLFISPRHLYRLFKEHFNCSPGDYLLNLRLKYALILLSKYRLKTTEVSGMCGFTDSSYFARRFRGLYGITPKQAKLLKL